MATKKPRKARPVPIVAGFPWEPPTPAQRKAAIAAQAAEFTEQMKAYVAALMPSIETFRVDFLRDQFAGQVLTGFIISDTNPEASAASPEAAAEFAYKVADAMLVARKAVRQ